MNQRSASLDELGCRFGTDKSSRFHNYLTFYERFFDRLRDLPITFLEIGVFGGASLQVWQEYFPNGRIIGADIDPTVPRFPRSRVTIELLDQSNIEDLVRLGIKHGPFDIIVEDGSHIWEHQITSLKTLFPFLRDGGIYIVEDLHTNFGPLAPSFRGVSSASCVDYLKKLVDLRVADDQIDIGKEEDAFLRTYGRAMSFIAFYRRACIIEKAYPQQSRQLPPDPVFGVSDPDAGGVKLGIQAHVGDVGERWSDSGQLRSRKADQNIQGFCLEYLTEDRPEITYRARLSNGSWTDWVGPGGFVGTRGQSSDLTGFAVRLGEASRAHFELQVVGTFRDETGPVLAESGEDCIPQAQSSWLSGIQVILRARSAPTPAQ